MFQPFCSFFLHPVFISIHKVNIDLGFDFPDHHLDALVGLEGPGEENVEPPFTIDFLTGDYSDIFPGDRLL